MQFTAAWKFRMTIAWPTLQFLEAYIKNLIKPTINDKNYENQSKLRTITIRGHVLNLQASSLFTKHIGLIFDF